MMKRHTREIQSFFFSQYFSDGLRISLGVLLPSLVLAQFGLLATGLTLSLGALCVSGADNPGPVMHKRNGMLICSAFMFIVAITTGFARLNVFTMGIEIVLFAFFFSMFSVYGNRAASVGTACLLIMILMMEQALQPAQILGYSATILAGSIWYTLLSITFFSIRPYRAAQQALGENMLDVAKFLRIKADFYRPETNIEDNYHKVVSQQIQVSHNQDAVRELLFKSRLVVKESTNASRILVLTFVDLVDLFEQIMATHYDYAAIHQKFEKTGILNDIARVIAHIADELDNLGFAIQANLTYKDTVNIAPELEKLKARIDELTVVEKEISNLVLKKILVNLRDMDKTIVNISKYYNSKSAELLENRAEVEYSKFVTHQDYDKHIYADNLTLSSSIFKHSLRVALVCLIGFIASKTVTHGHHSYWILLTIIVILKPGFSLTKQRNYQRLLGTIAGGAVGILVLYFVNNTTAQFVILMLFMIGAYSFQRLNYIVSVIFMTPYVLILFKFLGVGHVVEERIIDTIIGSAIAFIASYIIFPTWEFELIKTTLNDVLQANINYLMKVAESLSGKNVNTTEYKLARKDVYVYSANLSAAFERMTSEPKRRQQHIKEVHKFVVLNHILTSYIANIASAMINKPQTTQPDNLKLVKRSINILFESAKKVTPVQTEPPKIPIAVGETLPPKPEVTLDAHLLKEQLEFITKVSADIAKVTDALID
ncbi:putative membrane protein (TIGR01666 family) [Mucilaginibacter gracilis]|uniref:Putative membrane protein (TIGR01666 family) n=1 Tax=Mucilaginibacter gracilis TaxID=423350 RepID=A0A495J768_9SPHI|nr:FUSC family membrane protein [Mucilaginibacter gracilis]RKR83859.1 putative membrane protein (TIGR01666 family) [Mucilaginibacter gracilis]